MPKPTRSSILRRGKDGTYYPGVTVLIAAWLFGISGAVLAGIGGFFIFLRPPLLPEDLRYLERTAEDINELVPRMHRWLRLVFMALGGHAIAAGILTMYLAATAVRDGQAAAVIALAFAGPSRQGSWRSSISPSDPTSDGCCWPPPDSG